jgi:DNA polymerase-3 subunit alpha
VVDGTIRFGLSAIKGCGTGAAEAICAARQRDGEFRSLFDLCERVDAQICNRTTIETLIKAGALDSVGAKRSQQMAVVDRALQSGASASADRRSGQKNLFGADDADEEDAGAANDLPKLPEWREKEKLASEKEVLGFYLSSHPLTQHEKTLAAYCTHNTTELAGLTHRTEVMVGGLISAIKFSHTKNARAGTTQTKYAMFDLEDTSGAVRSILWPDQFALHGDLVEADRIVVVRGVVDRRPGSEEVNLIVNELIPLDELKARYTGGVIIRVDEQKHGERGLAQLREILRGYPGKKTLRLRLALADGTGVELACDNRRVEPNMEMQRRVDELLGPGNFRLITEPPKVSASPPRGGNGRDRAMAGR